MAPAVQASQKHHIHVPKAPAQLPEQQEQESALAPRAGASPLLRLQQPRNSRAGGREGKAWSLQASCQGGMFPSKALVFSLPAPALNQPPLLSLFSGALQGNGAGAGMQEDGEHSQPLLRPPNTCRPHPLQGHSIPGVSPLSPRRVGRVVLDASTRFYLLLLHPTRHQEIGFFLSRGDLAAVGTRWVPFAPLSPSLGVNLLQGGVPHLSSLLQPRPGLGSALIYSPELNFGIWAAQNRGG